MPLEDLETLLSSSEPRITRKTPEEMGIQPSRFQKGVEGVKEGFTQLGGRIKSAGEYAGSTFMEGAKMAGAGVSDIATGITGKPTYDPKTGKMNEPEKGFIGRAGQTLEGIGETVAGGVVGAFSPLAAPLGLASPELESGIRSLVESGALEPEKGSLAEKAVNYYKNLPEDQKTAWQALFELATAGTASKAEQPLKTALKETGEFVAEQAPKVARAVGEGVRKTGQVIEDITPDIIKKDVQTLRTEKITKGLETQNERLKSVNNSFNENTKVYKIDGVEQKITPIDTFSKYEIFPDIKKDAIDMGSYKNGEGALGKIKEGVEKIDDVLDTKLEGTGLNYDIEDLRLQAIEMAKADVNLKRSGKVSEAVNSLNKRFDDYVASYGNNIDSVELNQIRKVANRDWSPDTMDASRVIGDVGRKNIYDALPEGEAKNLLRDQGELLGAKKYAEKLNGTKVVGGRLGDYFGRVIGTMLGSSALKEAPVIGGIAGLLGADYVGKLMRQLQFKSPLTEAKALLQRNRSAIQEPAAKAMITDSINDISKTIPPGKKNVKQPFSKADQTATPKGLTSTQKKSIIEGTKTKSMDNIIEKAKEFSSGEDFYNRGGSVVGKLSDNGIRGKEQVIKWFDNTITPKEQILDSLNPTGGLYVDYTPQVRMDMKLGKNMTTLDKTSGKLSDDMVTIYRGAPKSQKEIVGGDFVTTNADLAKSYSGEGNVISKKVKMSDVLDDMDSPLGEEYIYRPKKADTATSTLLQEAKKYKSVDEFKEVITKSKPDDFIAKELGGVKVKKSEVPKELLDNHNLTLLNGDKSYYKIGDNYLELSLDNWDNKLGKNIGVEGIFVLKNKQGIGSKTLKAIDEWATVNGVQFNGATTSTTGSGKALFDKLKPQNFQKFVNDFQKYDAISNDFKTDFDKLYKAKIAKSTKPQTKLAAEAKKYKSADEFVKGHGDPVFRGVSGGETSFTPSEKGAFRKYGFSVADNKKLAKDFGDSVIEGYISPKAKIKKAGKIFEDIESSFDEAISEGFDGINFSSYSLSHKDFINETTIFNPDIIKTKAQLKDIWNKANQ